MDAAHASYAPDKAVMLIDTTDEASTSFWGEHNPEALAMAQGAGSQPCCFYMSCRVARPQGHPALSSDTCCFLQICKQLILYESSKTMHCHFLKATSATWCVMLCPSSCPAVCCVEDCSDGGSARRPAGWSPDRPATAFVCQNFTCKAPTTDPGKLRASLREAHEPAKSRPTVQQVDLSSLSKEASKTP